MWNHEPTIWERVLSLGLGTWILAGIALLAGIGIARAILIPEGAADVDSRAKQLARSRTLIGFVFVGTLSIPYRSVDDSLDKAWGNFNLSAGVALGVFVLMSPLFWLSLNGDSRDHLRIEWRNVWIRVGKFIAAFFAYWVAMLLCGVDSPTASPDLAWLGLIILFSFIGFFAMGCWCISCYWFGIGDAHPLLPPVVAAITICIMTVLELHSGGPEQLPLRLWLLINASAVITTFGVCFVEICDTLAESAPSDAGPARWPVVAATTVVVLTLAGATTIIATGGAERMLCVGASPLVQCSNAIEALR